MPRYLISTHGNPDFNKETRVPSNMTVLFHQPFGQPMDNDVGLQLQSALVNPYHPSALFVLQQHPSVAIWNTEENARNFTPRISLTGDNHIFYTGIVRADDNTVIMGIGSNQLFSLSRVLGVISQDAPIFRHGEKVIVHCLFCL